MEKLEEAVRTLREKLSRLEEGAACPGDWVRLEAAVRRAAIEARDEVRAGSTEAIDCEALCALMDELRYIKLCAEVHGL